MTQEWRLPPIFDIGPVAETRALAGGNFYSWGPEKMNHGPALNYGDGYGVLCAVLDTAGAKNHKDLPDAIEYKIWTGESSGFDGNGHGSHVWGTVFEWAPKADFAIHKVLTNGGSGSTTGIANAIRHLTKRWISEWRDKKYGFLIISMSLGGGFSADIDNAMKDAVAAGIIFSCAAGNSGNGGVDHPGNSKFTAMSVAAIDSNFNVANFSSRGPQVTICMPGVNINSTWPGDTYRSISGTSMATPAATGLAACALSTVLDKTEFYRDQLNYQMWVKQSCKDLGTPGRDTSYGEGVPVPTEWVYMRPFRFV